MKTITIDLGYHSYPIHIGQQLLQQKDLIAPHVRAKQVCIVTNETIAPLYLEQTKALFADFNTTAVILPDGEEFKNLTVLNQIFDHLLKQRHSRQTTLVALGGGVIGDMTGFAAASYQRGVHFLQIPTTLLAQVDSSVGGKTGVNHALGKNMIGAFHQPHCVLIDTDTLSTLDDRQLGAGLAEVVKYSLLGDAEFITWLEQNTDALLQRNAEVLRDAIARCCQNKANIVVQDEREAGVRALLNLGHTFGHAIETGMGYGVYLHGEAVAIGMALAADLSQRLGWINSDDQQRAVRLMQSLKLPTQIPRDLSTERMIELMGLDKKVQDGAIRLVLLKALGQAIVTQDYSKDAFEATLQAGY